MRLLHVWSTCLWAAVLSTRSICILSAHRLFLHEALGPGWLMLDGQSSEAAGDLS
ncbi:hypothetical protein J3F83DRAFT_94722 [Trichoderma novae-zelandiae]